MLEYVQIVKNAHRGPVVAGAFIGLATVPQSHYKVSMQDLIAEWNDLKAQHGAILLAHYYQDSEIQDLADVVGDSLELARKAQAARAKTIVFAGVHFMAEGAKILNPEARVLMPDLRAGCSLSDSCPPHLFKQYRDQHPDVFVVSYINCSAAIKAMSDVICTSSNAVRIVSQVPKDRPILFAPDRNLGAWVSRQTGRAMTLWPGSCIVHETFSERKIIELKHQHPDALLIAHPECEASLLAQADFIGSTSQLLKFTQTSPAATFIVATEEGILHQMQKASPQKRFLPAPPNHACACNECPFMKLNTLEKLVRCLRNGEPEIHLPEELRRAAHVPLQRMLEWSA